MFLEACVILRSQSRGPASTRAECSCGVGGRVPMPPVGCRAPAGRGLPRAIAACARTVATRHQVVTHHVTFVDPRTSVELKRTLIQKAKYFDQIPCLVIPASALVKAGDSEIEMQSVSLNGGRKLALKTETKPRPQFYLFTY